MLIGNTQTPKIPLTVQPPPCSRAERDRPEMVPVFYGELIDPVVRDFIPADFLPGT